MRTTMDVDEALLREVVSLTGEKNKGKAVNRALKEYVRRKRVEELQAMAGHLDLVDNLAQLEEEELKEMDQTQWSS